MIIRAGDNTIHNSGYFLLIPLRVGVFPFFEPQKCPITGININSYPTHGQKDKWLKKIPEIHELFTRNIDNPAPHPFWKKPHPTTSEPRRLFSSPVHARHAIQGWARQRTCLLWWSRSSSLDPLPFRSPLRKRGVRCCTCCTASWNLRWWKCKSGRTTELEVLEQPRTPPNPKTTKQGEKV